MKIEQLKLENFKCFKTEKTFDFEKITLLTGANNSGKSTVMQALLSVIQSDAFPFNYSPNGKYVNLGDFSKSNIVNIIIELQKQDRLVHFDKKTIERFQKDHFIKKILKKLQSNAKDRNHLPIVLLSDRKMALSEDAKFLEDLQQFTTFSPRVAKHPEDLDYEN